MSRRTETNDVFFIVIGYILFHDNVGTLFAIFSNQINATHTHAQICQKLCLAFFWKEKHVNKKLGKSFHI
jgi:hypothetical protein